MKAIILCAGNGERLRPLTDKIPKPLIKINNKMILFYILASLPDEIDEIFLVIKEKHLTIFKKSIRQIKIKKKINFLFQDDDKKGTYYAVMAGKDVLKNEKKFLVLNGDDIFTKEDLKNLIKMEAPAYGISFKKLNKRYRTCDIDKKNHKIISFRRQNINELKKKVLSFSGSLTLTDDFFVYKPTFYEQKEAGLPHTLFNNNKQVSYIILKKWIQINDEKDLIKAPNLLQTVLGPKLS